MNSNYLNKIARLDEECQHDLSIAAGGEELASNYRVEQTAQGSDDI